MAGLTPMMQQYVETKKQYEDCIVFYRLGDFYEMFFEDALIASKELEITLTGKSCGLDERAPMCGIPYHAVEMYLNKLVKNGHKVAIVEQVEDPATAKGLVKREVVRIVTPGTNFNASALEEGKNNYLMCIVGIEGAFGISVVDVSTGDYYVTEVKELRSVLDEIHKYLPSEIVCNNNFMISGADIDDLKNRLDISIYPLESWYFDDEMVKKTLKEHFKVMTLSGLGLDEYPSGTIAAGALLKYLLETQKNSLDHLTRITPYRTGKFMILDTSTRRNLELCETLREKQKRGSLLWVLDKTKTAMGARMMRSFIEQPLVDTQEILDRQELIYQMNQHLISRDELREYLAPIYDLERLIGRISYRTANPRDLISFKNSLKMIPPILEILNEFPCTLMERILEDLDSLEDLEKLIDSSILEEPPISVREGGILKEGYNEQVDTLKKSKTEGKTWLTELEEREKEKTGIKNLRIKYNKVFGYYLEVTNSYKELVPKDWVRKQTLANAERYTTDELKKLEDVILGAEDKLVALEYELFVDIRDKIAAEVKRIQRTAKSIAKLDVFASLAFVSERNNYVKPKINEKGIIDIKNGRHPVVEKMISNDMFVANNTFLDNHENRVAIITGPNMAGKSTYMRQVALIVLMAQIGSFVPASAANIGICDRIFTRVGASDDLASGQSTFMVEMTEVANILRNATRNSLLILDEIGRGTSTFDGLSIAWAVVEHINDPKLLGAKTLFATHYHELTELEDSMNSVKNYCIAVKEDGDNIVFLRKIVRGGADKSYGIQVAKLAGVPDSVIARAKELVNELSNADINTKAKEVAQNNSKILGKEKDRKKQAQKEPQIVDMAQMFLFDTVKEDDIIKEITDLDLTNMTPLQALNSLHEIQNKLKYRWGDK